MSHRNLFDITSVIAMNTLYCIVLVLPLLTLQKIEAFEQRLYSHPLHKDSKLSELYAQYEQKAKVTFVVFIPA